MKFHTCSFVEGHKGKWDCGAKRIRKQIQLTAQEAYGTEFVFNSLPFISFSGSRTHPPKRVVHITFCSFARSLQFLLLPRLSARPHSLPPKIPDPSQSLLTRPQQQNFCLHIMNISSPLTFTVRGDLCYFNVLTSAVKLTTALAPDYHKIKNENSFQFYQPRRVIIPTNVSLHSVYSINIIFLLLQLRSTCATFYYC